MKTERQRERELTIEERDKSGNVLRTEEVSFVLYK